MRAGSGDEIETTHVEGDRDLNSHDLGAHLCIARRAVMVVTTVEPRFNKVSRDWGNWFVISRVR